MMYRLLSFLLLISSYSFGQTQIQKLLEKAQSGDANAQFELGREYFYGDIVEENGQQAIYWLEKSVQQGNTSAMHLLGLICKNGWGTDIDNDKAYHLFKSAVDGGRSSAKIELAKCIYYGAGTPINYNIAFKLFTECAINLKQSEGMLFVGLCYYKGDGVSENKRKAVEWFEKAALLGDDVAQNFLASCYADGSGVKKDSLQSLKWLQTAAKNNNGSAQYRLCAYYDNGILVERDTVQTMYWLKKSVENNNPDGLCQMGLYYYLGQRGFNKDYEEAARLFSLAVNRDHVEAKYYLSLCYEYGRGVEIDIDKAISLRQESAEEGSNLAMWKLGQMYYLGDKFSKNYESAVYWYRKAADKGNPSAINDLPIIEYILGEECYNNGIYDKAFEYLKASAENSHNPISQAMRLLSACYRYGRGTKKNDSLATYWWEQALLYKNEDAIELTKMVQKGE